MQTKKEKAEQQRKIIIAQRKMIKEYRKTGKKPEGWTPEVNERMRKDDEGDAAYRERRAQYWKERNAAEQREKEKILNQSERLKIFSAINGLLAKMQEVEVWKDKIRLSDSGKKNVFADAIIEYLDTLPNDTRRIEACMDIIKICRNMAVNLQRV